MKMLITLCYLYLWVRFQKCYTVVIRDTLRRLYGSQSSSSFTFCVLKPPGKLPQLKGHQTLRQSSSKQQSSPPPEETVFLKLGDKAIYITEPQACDDVSKWTVLLGSSLGSVPQIERVSFIIEGTSGQAPPKPQNKALRWSDCCVPLACRPGQPFRAVAQASVDDFSRLGVAFLEDRLQLDDGLVPSKIVSVLLRDSALRALLEQKSRPASGEQRASLPLGDAQSEVAPPRPRPTPPPRVQETARGDSPPLPPDARRRLAERRGSEPPRGGTRRRGEEEEEEEEHRRHMEAHGRHLHLSSCHECLELENSTILSVKCASAEDIPDLPDDDCSSGRDSGATEAPDEAEDEDEDGASSDRRRGRVGGKPPNVLVYTGGCPERFAAVRALLAECIAADSYAVYPLPPRRALGEPWLDSAALLVLAEREPLTPQLQARFLSFLALGGRVLGLASSLCPAGVSLVPGASAGAGRVGTLSFTRADASELELSALASGTAFAREPRGGGEVEVWGEMEAGGGKDMVVVRVTHGEDGGEAVLCQVHLETAPDSQDVASEGFDQLKLSNARRYEVLTEILTSLGLTCDLSQAPPPSPVYILSTSEERRARFLKWLHTQVDEEGRVKASSRARLRLVPSEDELRSGPPLPAGTLALVTDPHPHPHPEGPSSGEQFSLRLYGEHLQTRALGRTVLYAEVTTTTMDLLEGLMSVLPEEMGLIAVADRQTQGRGRGGNAWLSPVGGAMFSLVLQVCVSSRLGQRIPFLQHLAALAVVEAVRTLPGYQDIDLRVKWPNDIYYGNLMKLGGVLVTSTVMGSTFHLLIGCGFNVSNSNPTICINDLVTRHNRETGSALPALSSSQLIGRTLTSLEGLITAFQQGGPQAVLPIYYKRWVHSGTRVRLWSEDGPEAEVVGLDDNGFLQVRSAEQGVVSVQPDGNSFDMLRNLVVTKQH